LDQCFSNHLWNVKRDSLFYFSNKKVFQRYFSNFILRTIAGIWLIFRLLFFWDSVLNSVLLKMCFKTILSDRCSFKIQLLCNRFYKIQTKKSFLMNRNYLLHEILSRK
jgi:hypothetical protein